MFFKLFRNIITEDEHVARMREMRNAITILVVKYEGKRQLWRITCRRKDNIKVDLKEIC